MVSPINSYMSTERLQTTECSSLSARTRETLPVIAAPASAPPEIDLTTDRRDVPTARKREKRAILELFVPALLEESSGRTTDVRPTPPTSTKSRGCETFDV